MYLEIRSHGVAYYQFATDEEKRQEQLAALNKLRDQVSIYGAYILQYCNCFCYSFFVDN